MTAPPTPVPPGAASHLHWWCCRCGRWAVVDDRDICEECAFHVSRRPGAAAARSLARALSTYLRRSR